MEIAPQTTAVPPAGSSGTQPDRQEQLTNKAKEFEAAFLAEMLKAAGVGKPLQTFGGGAGEEAFSGFLVQEYANQVVATGGLGLAASIVNALSEDQV
ncbi:rod-binding protein [Algicella marina]|uniref:Flagellar biosynthesis protein FlgJ n=1 Tax=Algicella marina TaxID=2683284 RepID=A0A6P1T125_9RHOB|nr:rod-binding protein [Algicella marina]QHQ36438.1 flagellar biosynthesis protein FlgJ [Algicella marina]